MGSKISRIIDRIPAKYREMASYLVFGVLTTAVNYLCYYALSRLINWDSTVVPTAISWIVAVLFAYLTNRRWVFKSTARGLPQIAREITAFVGSRVLSGGIDVAIMYLLVDIAGFNDMIVKLLSNVIVVILNYIFSKLFVFRHQKKS